ncbi:MAG: phosphoserine phosphatase SerB [Marivibrio sp.]|uniref:phosphoserine phosphatase SerB n=1 Tax=Marivibrio sp. TaxID=2039719 RepID=UPI0032EC97C9
MNDSALSPALAQVLTLVAPGDRGLTDADCEAAAAALSQAGASRVGAPRWLCEGLAVDLPFEGLERAAAHAAVDEAAALVRLDRAAQAAAGRRKRMLIADMDSTMIEIETLDTIASLLGFGEEVAEITRRSMNGEIGFEESLVERVALLADHPADETLAQVMARVTYTQGGETLVRTMAANGARCLLVSGGFTFTTEVVHRALGFHAHKANVLEVVDGRFTGRVKGSIVGRATKRETLEALAQEMKADLREAATVGDGANDLDMLQAAGLGVGYRAKPIVRAQAPHRIDHTDLSTLLYYQGYRFEEFVTA